MVFVPVQRGVCQIFFFLVEADETLLEVSVCSSRRAARDTERKHLAGTESHNAFAWNADLLVLKEMSESTSSVLNSWSGLTFVITFDDNGHESKCALKRPSYRWTLELIENASLQHPLMLQKGIVHCISRVKRTMSCKTWLHNCDWLLSYTTARWEGRPAPLQALELGFVDCRESQMKTAGYLLGKLNW